MGVAEAMEMFADDAAHYASKATTDRRMIEKARQQARMVFADLIRPALMSCSPPVWLRKER